MTLSKNRIKYIHSLELKKKRRDDQVFVAEGPKLAGELLGRFPCRFLAATHEWLQAFPNAKADEVVEVTDEELSKAGFLKTPQQVLAIFQQPEYEMDADVAQASLCLALDDVQDPGNLGTIIRLADWFGIEHVFCSLHTADIYNPKAVQASMGAIARVKVHYTSLFQVLSSLSGCPVYGTFLDGKNIYQESLSSHGLIVMGNEGNGISRDIAGLIGKRLYIPHYPEGRQTSESLNVAIATAITCAEFRRQMMANDGRLK
ncbi:MAG: RNA methyltransferase [Mediterranea sp.]|jgi:TrmH family RNA methyltransferase|nr:RNA methyltransferase [Mediterranea sp.]